MITSQLDYCNSILKGLPAEQIARLQKVRNCAATFVMRESKRQHNYSVVEKNTLASGENPNWIQQMPHLHNATLKDSSLHIYRLLFQIMDKVSVYGSLSVERSKGIEIRWGWGGRQQSKARAVGSF